MGEGAARWLWWMSRACPWAATDTVLAPSLSSHTLPPTPLTPQGMFHFEFFHQAATDAGLTSSESPRAVCKPYYNLTCLLPRCPCTLYRACSTLSSSTKQQQTQASPPQNRPALFASPTKI